MSGFFALAFRGDVVRRALLYAVIVGSVLISINYGDRILRGELVSRDFLKMALTVCVPYTVSTLSSVSALRQFTRSG